MSKTPSRCTSYSRLFSIVDYFSTRPRMPTQADRSSIDSIGSLLVWMLNHLINMILMHPGGGTAITVQHCRLLQHAAANANPSRPLKYRQYRLTAGLDA